MQYDRWDVMCAMKRETHHLVAVFVHCRSPYLACSSGIKKTTNLPSFPLPPYETRAWLPT